MDISEYIHMWEFYIYRSIEFSLRGDGHLEIGEFSRAKAEYRMAKFFAIMARFEALQSQSQLGGKSWT